MAVAKPYGRKRTYQIPRPSLQLVLLNGTKAHKTYEAGFDLTEEEYLSSCKGLKKHTHYLDEWVRCLEHGVIVSRRPFSEAGVTEYRRVAKKFLDEYGCLSLEHFESEYLRIPSAKFATKDKLYKVLRSFAKYLIHKNELSPDFLEQQKKCKPERHFPVKHKVVSTDDYAKLVKHCISIQDRLIVKLLYRTGMRSGEVCRLKWEHIDFENREITIEKAKWGKSRKVGISEKLYPVLRKYYRSLPKDRRDGLLLLDRKGRPMIPNGLYQRVRRVAKNAGIDIHAHAFRHGFITRQIMEKGIIGQKVQVVVGHSRLETTMGYCHVNEQQIIDEMKRWD